MSFFSHSSQSSYTITKKVKVTNQILCKTCKSMKSAFHKSGENMFPRQGGGSCGFFFFAVFVFFFIIIFSNGSIEMFLLSVRITTQLTEHETNYCPIAFLIKSITDTLKQYALPICQHITTIKKY